jgi:GNAT superfamily N-acetyltransferase
MTGHHDFGITQVTHPHDADAAIRKQMTDCWIAVSNAGGAAGFPFPSVDARQVAPAVDHVASRLDPQQSRILLALDSGTLTGWVAMSRDANPLIAHWGTVNHLQTQPEYRSRGIGSALIHELRRIARDEMGSNNSISLSAAELGSKTSTPGSAGERQDGGQASSVWLPTTPGTRFS